MPLFGPRLHRWLHGELPVCHHPDYRLPVPSLEHLARRVPSVAWWLTETRLIGRFREPTRIGMDRLAAVHDPAWIDALTRPEALTAVFGMPVPVDSVMDTLRYVVGGTVLAKEAALARDGAALNLAGGFHHAFPGRGHGFSPVNDIAVAAAGFAGQIGVLDLDAHPPDGTAACLPHAWIGSISGVAWDPMENVDDVVLPGADDRSYLQALEALLRRIPNCALWFVVAGGDVLAEDPIGRLSLSLAGARRRDRMVAEALDGLPAVWLPGGGYTAQSWRVLAGTAAVLAGQPDLVIPADYDPLHSRFSQIFTDTSDTELSASDIDASLRMHDGVLGWYTASGVELALERYGILTELRRLGYSDFRVKVDRTETGDRTRLFSGQELLVESVVERSTVAGRPVIWVHWLNLRHPRGAFSSDRPRLPGQDVPGLGLAREAVEIFALMANRLGLDGVAMRPMQLHVAWMMRPRMQFLDPVAEAEFLALERDLRHVRLPELSRACAEGRLRRNGEPWTWKADTMVGWREGSVATVEASPDHFSVG